jgi:isopenicillin N synthase-like dioxygenase
MAQATIDSLPPFPNDLHTAPIAQISSRKLLDGDKDEAQRVLEACQTFGFFYLDLRDSSEGKRLIDGAEACLELAKTSFGARDPEEQKKWHLQKGVSMFGYKSAGTVKKTDKEARPDTTAFWNLGKDHFHGFTESRDYPPEIEDARPLVKRFTQNAHECGMIVLRTLALAMNLPAETFTELNTFTKPAGDHCRLTYKYPHATDKNAIGLPSHTDFGTVTILFNWLG